MSEITISLKSTKIYEGWMSIKKKAKGRGSCKSVRGLCEIRERECGVVFGWKFAVVFGCKCWYI